MTPSAFRRCRGRERSCTARNSRKAPQIARSFPFFPARRSGHRGQAKSWRIGLYGDGNIALAAGGAKKGKSKEAKSIAAAIVAAPLSNAGIVPACRRPRSGGILM